MKPMDVIFGLAELYRRDLGEEAQAMWFEAIDGIPLDELRAAARVHTKQSKWMPSPAEILDVVKLARKEKRREADYQHRQDEHRINYSQAIRSTFNIPNGMRLLDYVDQELKAGRDLDEIVDEVCEPNRREP